MVKHRCPDCDELIEITPTGERQREGWTAEWWRLVLHPDKHRTGKLCDGGGRRV